ncbi:MEDS domain-containing protein [Bacillus suaedaesalsae]|uniref:MEDS domain-containing protein n=1 Tax=Bacillus suaedaesalsae TaxID=2810349 RepID=A0ABS2DMB4_9BACI|nr:MEDS domain-containing protein [Bacillus suaedaesalsae]MBM6619655.1 MEDS domain-containing protein [Bacillus suaedaesalsae]
MSENIVRLNKMIDVTNHGHILYIYDSIDCYIDNASTYIFTGVEEGHQVLFIERKELFEQILQTLEQSLTPEQLKNVHFCDNQEYYRTYDDFNSEKILEHFSKTLQKMFNPHLSVRTWANVDWKKQESISTKLEHFEIMADECVRDSKVISVCAYCGERISATLQNKLLRSHDYFMTDHEFVKSNLYQIRNVTFPSLWEQKQQIKVAGELKATQHQLQSFIMQNLDPIIILDSNDIVVTVNESFASTFGYETNEILGLCVYDLPFIPSNRINEIYLNRSITHQGEKVQGYETIRQTKDGRNLAILVSGFPLIDEDNNVSGWAVILREITEKKHKRKN